MAAPDAESVLTVLYAHALRWGGLPADAGTLSGELGLPEPAVTAAVAELKRLHLLRLRPGPGDDRLVPADPEVATAALVSPIDEEVQRGRLAISQIHDQLDTFRAHYAEHQRSRSDHLALEEVHDRDELAGHLYIAAKRCEGEFVSFRPNQTPDEHLPPGGRAMLERGVRVRLLLQHAARTDIRARSELDTLIEGGAEVRTASQLSRHLMVFDTDVAFLLHDAAGAKPIAVVIRNASAVRLLLDLVETTWSSAHPYLAKSFGYQEVAGHLHQTIIQLLSEGLTDEAVARRLGVSVRTCRRHIATVLRDLDAVSRFQAGVRVGAAHHDL